jgi:hypothetical protein
LINAIGGKQVVIIVHGRTYRKVIFEIVLVENSDVVIKRRKESSSVLVRFECQVKEKIIGMIIDTTEIIKSGS